MRLPRAQRRPRSALRPSRFILFYHAALPLADRIHLTVVDAEPAGDTFMPDFDRKDWREVSSETFNRDERHPYGYRYSVLERVRS